MKKFKIQSNNRRGIVSGIPADKIKYIFGKKRPTAPEGKNKIISAKKRENMVQSIKRSRNQRPVPQVENISRPVTSPLPSAVSSVQSIPENIKKISAEDIEERLRIEGLNSNRVCIINQRNSMKDIILCEQIARSYQEKGYKVVWPVNYTLTGMNKHSKAIDFINTDLLNIDYDSKKFHNSIGSLIIPLKYSAELIDHKCAIEESRYALWNLPVSNWKQCSFLRDKKAEDKLFYRILQLNDGDKYNFINEYYHNDFSGRVKIEPPSDTKNIYLEKISNFTLLDWSKVIERASGIYTVDNAVLLWVELLNTIENTIHVYPRNIHDVLPINTLQMTKNYIVH